MTPIETSFVFALIMFLGSLLGGLWPLGCKLGAKTLDIMGQISTGILLGVVLGIIIPEGVNELFVTTLHIKTVDNIPEGEKLPEGVLSLELADKNHQNVGFTFERGPVPARILVGGALIAGFIVMLLLDQINFVDKEGKQERRRSSGAHIVMSEEGSDGSHSDGEGGSLTDRDNEEDAEHSGGNQAGAAQKIPKKMAALEVESQKSAEEVNMTALKVTFGMMIHTVIDGFASGVSCFAESAELQIILLAALLIHKMLETFGLSAYYLGERLQSSTHKRYIIMYSLSAPVVLVLTAFMVVLIGLNNSDDATEISFEISLCLLFSAGSFLYVSAVHVLGEDHDHGHGHDHDHHEDGKEEQLGKWTKSFIILFSMLIPSLIIQPLEGAE